MRPCGDYGRFRPFRRRPWKAREGMRRGWRRGPGRRRCVRASRVENEGWTWGGWYPDQESSQLFAELPMGCRETTAWRFRSAPSSREHSSGATLRGFSRDAHLRKTRPPRFLSAFFHRHNEASRNGRSSGSPHSTGSSIGSLAQTPRTHVYLAAWPHAETSTVAGLRSGRPMSSTSSYAQSNSLAARSFAGFSAAGKSQPDSVDTSTQTTTIDDARIITSLYAMPMPTGDST